jgi:hypothetical protein
LDLELPLNIVDIHLILEKDVPIQLPNKSFSFSIKQIPIIPTYVLAIDKCERLTFSTTIFKPLLHPLQQTPKKNDTFYTINPLSQTILKHFQVKNVHFTKDTIYEL